MNFIFSLARALGYDITLTNRKRPDPIRLWQTDQEFAEIYSRVNGNTAVNQTKLYILYGLAKNSKGAIAEVGAYKGGSAFLMASATEHPVHVFDTFECMPDTDEVEDPFHFKGDFKVDTNKVLDYLHQKENIRTYPGIFPETSGPIEDEKFGLVHVDIDIYKSMKDCLEFFYPRMLPGGVIISDDYGHTTCPGALKAWDEFFANKPEASVYLGNGQALIIKV